MGARMKGMGPGCCCVGEPICDTDFSSAGLSDWTQVAGTWAFTGGIDFETSDANALIVNDFPHPNGLSQGRVTGFVQLPDSGAIRMILGYKNPGEYLFTEVEILPTDWTANADVYWRIGKRVGGVDTILEEANGTAATGTFQLCYNGTRIACDSSNLTVWHPAPGTSVELDSPLTGNYGDKVAFQAIDITGTFKFRNVTFFGEVSDACALCAVACNGCSLPDGTPGEVSIYIDGVVSAECGTCEATFNGSTFILPPINNTDPGDVNPLDHPYSTRSCVFYDEGFGCATIPANDWMRFIYGSTNTAVLSVIAGDGGWNFTKTLFVCTEVLTKVGGSGGVRCDWTGATAIVTPNMA